MASLIEANKLAYQHCEATYEQFNQICAPLLNLGINYFCYIKIIKDGRFFVLYNELKFLQDWLFQPGGFGDVAMTFYEKHEPKSYILSPYDALSLQKDRTLSLLARYQITSSFNIFKRDKGDLTGYHFYSTSHDPLFSRFYLQNIPLLEHFVHYFNQKAKKLIHTNDKRKFGSFYQKPNIPLSFPERDLANHKINQFLWETQLPITISKKNKEKMKLTKREGQCLHYLSQGNTFKEIGGILNLSPRTVEFYIKNLREKTGYQSRKELIAQFDQRCFVPLEMAYA